MITFFFIAGFFARMSLERLGLRNFAFDRLKRIALPLVVAWLPIFMAIVAVSIWSATIANGGKPLPASPQPALNASNFPLTHLWFLYVLLIFYVIFVVLHVAFHKNVLLSRVLKSLVQIILGWGGVVLIALPMILSFYFNPSWLMWFGIPTPDTGLLPNTSALGWEARVVLDAQIPIDFGYSLRHPFLELPIACAVQLCWGSFEWQTRKAQTKFTCRQNLEFKDLDHGLPCGNQHRRTDHCPTCDLVGEATGFDRFHETSQPICQQGINRGNHNHQTGQGCTQCQVHRQVEVVNIDHGGQNGNVKNDGVGIADTKRKTRQGVVPRNLLAQISSLGGTRAAPHFDACPD